MQDKIVELERDLRDELTDIVDDCEMMVDTRHKETKHQLLRELDIPIFQARRFNTKDWQKKQTTKNYSLLEWAE